MSDADRKDDNGASDGGLLGRVSESRPPTAITPDDRDPAAGEPKQPAAFLGATETEAELTVAPRKRYGDLKLGLLFLGPNIIGFLAFTLVPLIASLVFALTNWDLKAHNRYKGYDLDFIGFGNFVRLLEQPDFFKYLGNTLFFMMGIPFGIAASLVAALMLSRDLGTASKKTKRRLLGIAFAVAGVLLGLSLAVWLAAGGGIWAMGILFAGVTAAILIGGVTGGQTVYRTLFYLPHFTSGVATFILWKAIFNPQQGPLTLALAGPLAGLEKAVDVVPPGVTQGVSVLLFALAAAVLWFGLSRMRTMFRDGDLGSAATFLPALLLILPAVVGFFWLDVSPRFELWLNTTFGKEIGEEALKKMTEAVALAENTQREVGGLGPMLGGFFVLLAFAALLMTVLSFFRGQALKSKGMEGFGSVFVMALALMVAQFVLIGLGATFIALPGMAASNVGLTPPSWLSDPRWVKPSLMLVGFWGAVGSNTMLLYLAALTNVPGELYEAADIDGARPFDRFWNVTWPQLAPTTFFVVVMATIGGLQGGFEMVRTMTQGGPAGASTPLAYYVYTEGFEVGRIGFASGVAWALFLLILVITLFNWTFGNKYVND